MKNLKVFLLILLSFSFVSCLKEHDGAVQSNLIELQSPYGKWKMEGYIVINGKAMEHLTAAKENAYSLILSKEGTFTGVASVSDISGKYYMDEKIPAIAFTISEFALTDAKRKETKDGIAYLQYLQKVKSYRVFYNPKRSEKYLHLYFTNTKESYLEYRETSGLYSK